jgi:hypothetical protein
VSDYHLFVQHASACDSKPFPVIQCRSTIFPERQWPRLHGLSELFLVSMNMVCLLLLCSTIFAEGPAAPGAAEGSATYMSKAEAAKLTEPSQVNNYSRPNGQNVRTLHLFCMYITDASHCIGMALIGTLKVACQQHAFDHSRSLSFVVCAASRSVPVLLFCDLFPVSLPQVGNYITDRPSSRVTAPPGGASQVHFGPYDPTPEVRCLVPRWSGIRALRM